MTSTSLFIACFFLIFCFQARQLLGADTIKYEYFPEEPKMTWDQANDLCRKNNLVLPYCFTNDHLHKLRDYIESKGLEPKSYENGYWMNGRAENKIFRWDFLSKAVTVNGWDANREEPAFATRASDGVVQGCMEIINSGKSDFSFGGLVWRSMWCDEKRPVICQSY